MEELEAIIEKMKSNGESQETIDLVVNEYKKRNPNVDFQTPTTPGAVVEETAAPDMDSKSEKSSLVSQDEFDASKELSTADDLFKANLKRAEANMLEVPAFFNRWRMSLAKLFLSDEQKENFEKLSAEEQDKIAQNVGSAPTFGNIGAGALKGQEAAAKLRSEAEELEKNLIQYDSDITDTIFKEGNITEGATRLLTQAIGTIPSIGQAMIPYVGIPSIVAGSAAEASREAVYDEGKKIDLKQNLYASGIGASEGLLEIVTKRIGTTAFKNLIGKPKDAVKKTLLQTGTGIVKAGGAEGLSETGTLAINKFLESKYYNNKGLFDMDKEKWDEFWEEAGDTFLIGMATGKGMASVGAGGIIVKDAIGNRAVNKSLKKANIKEISEAFVDNKITDNVVELSRNQFSEKALNTELNNKVNLGDLSLTESNDIKLNFKNAQAAITLADNLKIAPSLINETVSLIQERNKLSTKIKEAGENKALVSEESKRLVQLDNRLAEISKENISIKLDERIEKLEKPIKEPGSLLSDPFGIVTAADKIRQTKLEKAKEQKFSNEVQEIYNEKGEAGALDIIEKFKPITNKLVRKRKDAPNYDEQLLRDEIETGERGIFDLIRSYKPDSGVPLSGYINKFLKARAIEASNRVLGKEFTQDVTEIKESKIDLDDTTQETLDFVRTEPKAKEQLRDVAGITKESVQKDAAQILKGKLPGVIEKSGRDKNEILTAINNASKLKIADSVLEEMGGNFNNKEEQNSRFITFMDVNFEATMKAIPNSVKNKLPLFEAKQVDRETMTEGDAAGKGIFEYKNPTRDEFIKYYTEGSLTTLRAKKKKLADILAQEIGKDAIAEVLQDPAIQKDFLERQELQGKKIPEGAIPKLLERIDRAINNLEKSNQNVLSLDLTLGVKNLVKKLYIEFLKGLRKLLKKGIDFKVARDQAIAELQKDLNLSEAQAEVFKKETNKVKPEDIISGNGEQKLDIAVRATVKKRYAENTKAHVDTINSSLNSDIDLNAKKNILFDFFKYINPAYQKQSANHKLWEGDSAAAAYKFWNKKFNGLKQYGITLEGNKIKIDGKDIFLPVGKTRPRTIKNTLRNAIKKLGSIQKAITEIESVIDETDSQALQNRTFIINHVNKLYQSSGPQAAIDFISILGLESDSALRLSGNIRFYENTNGSEFVYEHTPPISLLQKKIINAIKANKLSDIKNILESSKVDLISKKSEQKLNELGRKITGEDASRYNGAIDSKNLIEIKRPKQKIKEETDNINLDKEFNNILENKTGIKSVYRYAKAKAEVAGKDKGSFDYIGIPPSAQDFMGLIYKMIGKGKQGDAQLAWFKKNLLDPFAKAMVDISNTRVALANDFKQIKKIANIAPKVLKNKLPGEPFTVEQAIRVYIWNKQNMDVDGLSQADLKTLVNYVKEDANLLSFADQLIQINKDMAYPKPDKNWLMGTMTTDLLQGLNTTTRKEALSQWQSNVDIIFNEANMNKLEAAFGKGYRSALNNMLQRMQTGRNRGYPGDQLTGRFVDWLNGSVGAIMFFNMRSAVLQTISSINFINFTDNNPLKAAAAFANQPQFWKDVMFIMNSDYLIERRNGLKINVNEADIAEIAAESKNKAKAFVNKLLKLGFLPTQIADSFAIATGGASFYRNRVKSYIKKGLSEKEAQDKAFLDFREITEENQQSSRPDRISQQQAGPLGRIILAFANTPAQYARIIQRAASDLKNGRGDAKTNISKIIYYGAVQNVIFNAMQQALFAIAFGDEEPDDEKEAEKYGNIVNGMVDSLLRGTGFAGAAVSTVKNAIIKIAKDGNKQDVAIDLINISPPISSKIRKVRSAGRTFDWNKKEIKEKGLSLDNPAAMAIGQLVSATTNVPLDRGIKKLTNIKDALDTENEEWMRVANALGWSKWELEWTEPKKKKTKKYIQPKQTKQKSFKRKTFKRN